jgi:hypothetical protein
LAKNQEEVTQLAGRDSFLFVFKAQFPDVRTGNKFLLEVGFDYVDNNQHHYTQQT